MWAGKGILLSLSNNRLIGTMESYEEEKKDDENVVVEAGDDAHRE